MGTFSIMTVFITVCHDGDADEDSDGHEARLCGEISSRRVLNPSDVIAKSPEFYIQDNLSTYS